MAKLTVVLGVLLVTFLAIASAHRTTITTTVVEDEINPGQGGQRCQQKIQQQQQQLRHCQQYLSQTSPFELDMYPQQGQQQQQLKQCCQALQNFDEQCRCEAVKHAVRQLQQQGGGWQGEQMQQVMQKARTLPRMCNMEPQECQIRAVFV
ncbi:hypothetical protein ACH5RR_037899 [Cinchona calisaya]|uniref:Bifunctional inhibitor/plant lipid transfer protein/seed storage helical domain-containing protein n=1 Tax=Cinchona calisaya TaxID=153742 RepID=A0ABD2Y8Q3_9GENT